MLDADTIGRKENDRSTMRLVESSVTRTQQNFQVSLKPTASEESMKKNNVDFDRFYDTPRDSAISFCEQHVDESSYSMMNGCVQELESYISQSSASKI